MLLLLVFGFLFYRLAEKFDKNRYLWTLIGAGSFVLIQLLFGFLYGILLAFNVFDLSNEWLYSILISLLSGGIVYYGYTILKKKWDNEDLRFSSNQIDEIGNKEKEEN